MKKIVTTVFIVVFAYVFVFAFQTSSKGNLNKKNYGKTNTQNEFIKAHNSSSDINFDFEKYTLNQLPPGWSQYYSGSGGTDWKIKNDDGNKVFAQLYSNNSNGHFNIVVNNGLIFKNMELSVRLKGITGKHDQGGGLVWRFTDKNNYYVVRANPLEDNVVLYKVENGKRSDLPLVGKGKTYGISVDKLGNGWNDLKIRIEDELFTVFLNGKKLFKVRDDTFINAGKIGFWTKADAVTFFDDLNITKF